jgi:predicted ArsR family transcriptional regulator
MAQRPFSRELCAVAGKPIKPTELLFHPTRLGLIAHQMRCGDVSFTEAYNQLGIKWRGALQFHADMLAQAGLIRLEKSGVGNRRKTMFQITARGRQAFAEHRAGIIAITNIQMETEAAA